MTAKIDWQAVVKHGIEIGLVNPAPVSEPDKAYRSLLYERQARLRHRYISKGLRYNGEPRVNKAHPELKGLTGKEYHTAYVRLWRKENAKKQVRP